MNCASVRKSSKKVWDQLSGYYFSWKRCTRRGLGVRNGMTLATIVGRDGTYHAEFSGLGVDAWKGGSNMTESNKLESLTATELKLKFTLHKEISKSLGAYFHLGEQLYRKFCTFREKRLYQDETKTFAEYCQKHWGKSIRRHQQIMDWLKFCDQQTQLAEKTGQPAELPKNEWQFREMKKKESAHKQLTNEKRTDRSRIDAPISKEKVEKRDYSDAYTDGSTSSAKSDSEVVKDKLGYVVPDHILPLWKRGTEIAELMTSIRSLKLKITNYENLLDPLFRGFSFSTVQSELGTAWDHLNYYLPEVVCYLCEEKTSVNCALCGGRGFITKHKWDRSARKQDKETRPQLSV